LDEVILTNGTLLAIQNMTWKGKLGLREKPSKDFVVPKSAGGESGTHGVNHVKGIQHYECGLQWAGTYESGHEQPMYQPAAALRQLQWMLGRI
jgi:carboxypeptidase D